MATRMVIAAYRPRPGRRLQLDVLLNHHVATLRREGLATDRPVVLMRSRVDGAVVEIFEWAAEDAAELAANNEAVQSIRRRIDRVAHVIPIAELEESGKPFPEFEVIEGLNT